MVRARLFAHCPSPACAGHQQREVDGVLETTSFSYRDNGGDIPGEERSMEEPRLVEEIALAEAVERRDSRAEIDEARAAAVAARSCGTCARALELSVTPRPQYDPLSGFDPNYLVNSSAEAPLVDPQSADARVAALEAQVRALLEAQAGQD